MKKSLLFLLVPVALLGGVFPNAHAITIVGPPPTPGVIEWSGLCEDCPGAPSAASAYLDVGDLGTGAATDIGGGNLTMFSYWSSVFPSGLFSSSIVSASGMIPKAPNSTADVTIAFLADMGYPAGGVGCEGFCGSTWTFSTSADGSWSLLEESVPFDIGGASTFSPAAVPEPATLGLTALGLLALRAPRRRRDAC